MALTNFYIQSGASNLNAGSTTANAASLTYAGGTFVRSTGVFTVASGNPTSDGVVVGDWISIYTTSGAATATFVGQCTARGATTITVSLTAVLGVITTVSETAAATTAKVGGAWANPELVLGASGLGTFVVPSSIKINIKATTYTVAANLTVSMAGSAANTLWFSGYNTTPGDLDADTTNALAKPVMSLATSTVFTTSGDYQCWSGVSVLGDRNSAAWNISGNYFRGVRVRAENVNAGTGAIACTTTGSSNSSVKWSWFKTPTTATAAGVVEANGSGYARFVGCVAVGGGYAGFRSLSGGGWEDTFLACAVQGTSGAGFVVAASTNVLILYCTVANATLDGVTILGATTGSAIVGCLFSTCGGYGINASYGVDNQIARAANDFYACSLGNEHNLGDSPAFFGQTESSDPLTSTTDLTVVSGRNARNTGFPGVFENQTYSSVVDIGAVDHADAAAAALPFITTMSPSLRTRR